MEFLSEVQSSKLVDDDYNCVVVKLRAEDKVKDCSQLQEHGLKIMKASDISVILTVKTM